ncbi:MAG: hypothetical protein AUJ92_13540 [Armatimonadetes bacterium CG2_30_59_28]|nr:hypothetical protein [Armatimonadota bacterium]OIO92731.1 MAG: hypothetical protein AUJ92_13540 [Armatimonadetes bacterium CG2_30_59_28]PIU66795.1 MAG: hypothetical protein COS85_03265 [Armatimonadetes bacterium CG07_land_8_20_14_0_80_59_28]PIX41523.1 MAG: hypothetical protein COZ56_11880 [Armatimonadetes bacterium CG_4_8_14_3_um_filter_58_9]PIY47856.1 MAG: hypothetical protein COZ05_04435 [Armatimonadetes bacterium CG_4_10_14_3_um_filter_59_10]PJB62981.1 MAG: hypothetical protein CO095_173
MDRLMVSTPISTLTVGQLKALIKESVEEALTEADVDAGLQLRPEVAERLQRSLRSRRQRLSHEKFWEAVKV